MINVVIHRFDKKAQTADVFSFKHTQRLRGGGGGGFSSLEVQVSPVSFSLVDRPNARDWITLEVNGDTIFVGRISSSSFSVESGETGLVQREPLNISAVGFLDVDLDIMVTPARSTSVGGLYGQREWFEKVVIPMAGQINGPVGKTLAGFLVAVYNCQVPGTVFGLGETTTKTLGECVYPVFDRLSAGHFAIQAQPVEVVQGFSSAGVQSITKAAGKASQLLTGTYQPNEQLIELTACLLTHDATIGMGGRQPVPLVGRGSPDRLRGRIMALRYRVAPFRVAALKDRIRDASGVSGGFTAMPSAAAVSRFDAEEFNRPTWKELKVKNVGVLCFRVNSSTSGSGEVSAATAWLSFIGGGDDMKLAENLGLPYFDEKRTARDGLRLQTTLWPFIPPLGGVKKDGPEATDIMALVSRLAATYYQFASPGAMFEEGSATLAVFSPEYEPGMVIQVPIGGRLLTAYVVAVTHDGAVDGDGHVEGTTTLNFARGLFDEALRDPEIPINEADVPTQTLGTSTSADPKKDCNEGRPVNTPAGRNPQKFNRLAQVPVIDWLKSFGLATIEQSGGDRLKRQMISVFDGTGTWGVGGETAQKNAYAASACMYVIQRYWRSRYPDARIHIAGPQGWVRNSSDVSHSSTAGFDFYIDKNDGSGLRVSAGAAWASLWRLEDNGRLPRGGKGLYLNVNPGGVNANPKGVSANEDGGGLLWGDASAGFGQYAGPGGSSGTHYDFAGYLSNPDAAGRRNPNGQHWLATDWDGDGNDELEEFTDIADQGAKSVPDGWVIQSGAQTGFRRTAVRLEDVLLNIADPDGDFEVRASRMETLAEVWPPLRALFSKGRPTSGLGNSIPGPRAGFDESSRVATREAVREYYNVTGRDDPDLWPPRAKVPNVMQVLAIEDWCDGGLQTTPPVTP